MTPTQAAMLIWATGAAALAWRIWRLTERVAERDCPCQRSRLTLIAGGLQAAPALLPALLLVMGLAWPGLAVVTPACRWRHRHDPRCPLCGMRQDPPRTDPQDRGAGG